MLNQNDKDVEDVGAAIREDRPLRPARAYAIAVGQDGLQFKKTEVDDPLPLGRQILSAAGADPVEEFSLFALLANGDFEDVRLDEPFDLRGRGTERFVMFRTDRDFKFTVDNHQKEWGKPLITGKVLRKLANIQPGYALYLEVRGGQDREVNDTDIVDLSKPGIERFITVIKETTEGLAALPSMDQKYLQDHGIEHEVVNHGGTVAVIFRKFSLPEGRFDQPFADALIILPAGYPDVRPDMFHLLPWARLTATGAYPRAADQAVAFAGQSWQRWSRHSDAWRPGVDGIHTMIVRMRHALEVAA